MDILIIDADSGARDVYANMLAGLFPGLNVRQTETREAGWRAIQSSSPDLALVDFHTCTDPFAFFKQLRSMRVPFIVLSREASERMIVECMYAGAIDFLAKSNIKLGYVRQVLARALLEIPRWNRKQEFLDTVTSYEGVEKYEVELQRIVLDSEHIGTRGALELIPGKSYRLIFQFCSVHSPSAASMDETARVDHMNMLLDRLGATVAARGGLLWMRKADANISVFQEDELVNAVLSAIECKSALVDLATRSYFDRPRAIFAMEASQVVYTKERGELVSEAINLTAHMAGKSNFDRGIILTAPLFERLPPRAKKYFFKIDSPFEGHTVYAFEYTA